MIKKPKITPKNVLKLHKDTIVTIQCVENPKGSIFYSCSKEGCARVLDLKKKSITNTLLLSKNGPTAEKQTQSAAPTSELQRIALDSGIDKAEVTEDLHAVLFSEDTVFGGYENGDIYCWNLQDGEVIRKLIGHSKTVTQLLQISPKSFVSSSDDKTIRCWDIKTGACENILKIESTINYLVKDKKILYVLIEHQTILLLDLETFNLLHSFSIQDKSVLTFAIKDNTIFAATTNCKIEAYDIKENDLELKYVLEGHKDWILCMNIYNNHLYTGSDDRTIKVWSIDQHAMIDEFTDHEDGVVCLEFCNNVMYSGSYDHSIRFWQIEEMFDRLRERKIMKREGLNSKK